MFYAMYMVNEEKYLMVAFKSLSERDTFVKYSEFGKVTTPAAEIFDYNTARQCRLNDRVVYNEKRKKIAHIENLYKPLMRA